MCFYHQNLPSPFFHRYCLLKGYWWSTCHIPKSSFKIASYSTSEHHFLLWTYVKCLAYTTSHAWVCLPLPTSSPFLLVFKCQFPKVLLSMDSLRVMTSHAPFQLIDSQFSSPSLFSPPRIRPDSATLLDLSTSRMCLWFLLILDSFPSHLCCLKFC